MADTRSKPAHDDRPRAALDRRRPYRTPTLIEYGSIAKLTQTNFTGSRTDGNGMRMYGTCL